LLAFPFKGISAEELKQVAARGPAQAGIRILNQGEYPVGDPHLSVQVATTNGTNGLTD
jgi:hypothetical protein